MTVITGIYRVYCFTFTALGGVYKLTVKIKTIRTGWMWAFHFCEIHLFSKKKTMKYIIINVGGFYRGY